MARIHDKNVKKICKNEGFFLFNPFDTAEKRETSSISVERVSTLFIDVKDMLDIAYGQ